MNKFLFSFTLLFCFSCTPNARDLTVMSYNVENFFDAKDNPNTNDETYLPLKHPQKKKCKSIKSKYYRKTCEKLNWTEERVSLKLKQHLKTLNSFPYDLDFLALIEVESQEIINLFKNNFSLKGELMTTGSDKRGINVALLYNKERFSLIDSKEIKPNFKTRNILKVTLREKISSNIFSVYINHWPSQRSPTEKRVEVAQGLQKDLLTAKGQVIVLGDFNTLDKETPSPFLGLRKLLSDASKDYRGPKSYFYKRTMSWNLLDRIFHSKDLKLKKFAVYNPEFITGVTEYTREGPYKGSRIVGLPKGYDHKKKKNPGFSDHFPVYAIFNLN